MRKLSELRVREEAFMADLEQLRREFRQFASELREPPGNADPALARFLAGTDESIQYQYVANTSVQIRVLTDLLQHLIAIARTLLEKTPEPFQAKAFGLAHQCLETIARGLNGYRGGKLRKMGAASRRLKRRQTKATTREQVEALLEEIAKALAALPIH